MLAWAEFKNKTAARVWWIEYYVTINQSWRMALLGLKIKHSKHEQGKGVHKKAWNKYSWDTLQGRETAKLRVGETG